MKTPNTLTITLEFTPDAAGAVVGWTADVLGERTSRMVAPYGDDDLPLVLQALDVLQDPSYPHAWTPGQEQHFGIAAATAARLAALGLWQTPGRVHPTAPRLVGQALYRALTADRVGAQALGSVRDHAQAQGLSLALELRFPLAARALAALPWELLWDDGPTPLLLGAAGGCTRRLLLPTALPPPLPSAAPLHILAIAPRSGIPPELRQIERAARISAWAPLLANGRATLTELAPATAATLLAAIGDKPPDIVHFYGHGRYEHGHGALLLDAEAGEEGWTAAETLATVLRGVGLVVLHACQGGQAHSTTLLSGVAPALSAAGVPAVLAMQFSIRSAAATQISGLVYAQLAQGASLQQALAVARRALFVAEPDRVSWFVPVLYLRARIPGPHYLRTAAVVPAAPADSTALVTQQVVSARGGSISRLQLHAAAGARQIVRATTGGQIRNTRLRAAIAASQTVRAADDGQITDLDLEARQA